MGINPDRERPYRLPEAEAERKILALDISQLHGFDHLLSPIQKTARLALATMQSAIREGYINAATIRRIADFGAGTGGPTFALAAIAKEVGAMVIALEKPTPPAYQGVLKEMSGLPDEQIIEGDGLEHLSTLDTKGIDGFDLITAFRMGPDISGELFQNLTKACATALHDGGNLLITSDESTLAVAKQVCAGAGLSPHELNENTQGNVIIIPHTLVIPKRGCISISRQGPPKETD